ncbi:MAG: ABC-ATPase domain-containing protein, partial [bacterium]
MQTNQQLRDTLQSIDRRPYPAYKSLKGEYRFPGFILNIDHVQGDPFAAPSHLHVRLDHSVCGFPSEYYTAEPARTALEDYLLRRFRDEVRQYSFRAHGSGKSGLISVSACGQEMIKRSSLEITHREIIARFHVGFPANGRTINAGELEKILFDFLPRAVPHAFLYKYQDTAKLREQIFLMEDQFYLRKYLEQNGYVAFVKDGSVLPRESGISDRPMANAVSFVSPPSLCVKINLPHKGKITGMGIKRGITLIVGGGYHGKSTLLDALQMAVYPHIAGDGREYIATDATAMKLRSEDGRFVRDIDVSMFISGLPNGKATNSFSTQDASGSTSQAAGIIEAIEAGSKTFLMDEDTSATNFMVRDAFMQRVIAREKEPITPFLERARDLFEKAGISTILVAGSSGAFFHIADTIIQMDSYVPVDITAKAKALCPEYPLYSGSSRQSHQPPVQHSDNTGFGSSSALSGADSGLLSELSGMDSGSSSALPGMDSGSSSA